MPLDWLNTPLDADLGELLARKKRGKAIETLRRQLQGRLAPPVAVRLQLADLLMQAGRIEEAVPVLLGLADEFAADGFVAKAVAILKRVDRVQPGRADIAERLEKLVHQQKRVSNLPVSGPRPSAAPEFGMEELDEGKGLGAAEAALAAAEHEPAPLPSVEGGLAAPAGYDDAVELPSDVAPPAPPTAPEPMAAEIEVEATLDEIGGPEPAAEAEATVEPTVEPMVEPMVEPNVEAMAEAIHAPSVDPSGDAVPLEKLEPAEDAAARAVVADLTDTPPVEGTPPVTIEPASEAVADLVANDAVSPGPPLDATPVDAASAAEDDPAAGATGPGVGRRIRRALWRFLGSLPGAEEGAVPSEQMLAPEGESVAAGEAAAVATESPAASDALSPLADAAPPSTAEPTPVKEAETTPASETAPTPEATETAAAPEASETPPAPAASAEAPAVEPKADVLPRADAAPADVDVEFPTPQPRPLEPLVPSLSDLADDDALLPVMPPTGEDAMSEETFRQNLLDIVEDVLHRPPPPETAEVVDRARVLDLARRMVASRLFKDLSDEELLAIVRGLRLHTYEAGDIVVTEGEPGQSLFTLTTGRVKVFVGNPDRRNFEVATLTEGDFFGEISSLSGRPRTATVVAADVCELLELDRPTLDSIARSHARVRDVLESSYIARASNPEAAAVRVVNLPDSGTRRKAIEVLESHFGESRWDPRMRLRLADVLLKAGKDEDAVAILVALADELAREGFADKAVAIIKKIEQVQRRNVEVVNLAPLLRPDAAAPPAVPAGLEAPAAPRPRALTDDRFHGWLVDLVRDTVGKPRTSQASAATADAPVLKAYGPGLLANPLFEGFSEEELVAFIHGLKLLSFEPGDVIVTEGESGQGVFILATGEVKVFVWGPDRRNVMVAALGEGSFFGEISTLSGRPRTATITAASACELLELDRAALDRISATHPGVRTVLEKFSAARSADPEAARARGERPPG